MKKSLAILIFLVVYSNNCCAQKSVPATILIQNGTIDFEYYKNKKQKMKATDFHISQYVEANHQYRQYLKYLEVNELDSLLQLAQPNRMIWDSIDVSKEDVAFLKSNYWAHPDFESYPVLGLNIYQIYNYLAWKSSRMNYAFLQKKGKVSKIPYQPFSPKEYVAEKSASWDEMIASFSVPSIIFETVTMKRSSDGVLSKSKPKGFEKWLQKHREFQFLAYQPKDILTKTVLQEQLFKMGIKPVIHTDVMKLSEYKNKCAYYELVTNLPLSMVKDYYQYIVVGTEEKSKEYEEKYDFPIIKQEVDDILMVKPKSNYGRFSGIEKKEGQFPLMVFRGVTYDKRTVISVKDDEFKANFKSEN